MNNRLYKFDNLKFMLIFLVVVGHLVDIYCSELDIMKKNIYFNIFFSYAFIYFYNRIIY